MTDDPIVAQVRRIRREIEAECGNDPREYLRLIREVQERFKDRVVRGVPQKALTCRRSG